MIECHKWCNMNCPKCNHEISDKAIAKHLGSKAKGVEKNFTDKEKRARAERLAKAREKRWPKNRTNTTEEVAK